MILETPALLFVFERSHTR